MTRLIDELFLFWTSLSAISTLVDFHIIFDEIIRDLCSLIWKSIFYWITIIIICSTATFSHPLLLNYGPCQLANIIVHSAPLSWTVQWRDTKDTPVLQGENVCPVTPKHTINVSFQKIASPCVCTFLAFLSIIVNFSCSKKPITHY